MMQSPDPATVPGADLPPPAPTPWRLLRSRAGVLGGVCRGLAEATGVDVTLVRLAFLAAALSGFGIVAYGVLWLAVPREDGPGGRTAAPAPPDTARWMRVALLVGAIVGAVSLLGRLTVGGFGPFHDVHAGPGLFVGLVLLAGGVAVLWLRRQDEAEPATTQPAAPPAAGALAATTATVAYPPPSGQPVTSMSPAPRPVPPRTPSRPALRSGVVVARVFAWLAVLAAIPAAIVAGLTIWSAEALSLALPGLVVTVVVLAIVGVIVAASMSRRVWPILLSLVVLVGAAGLAAALASWQGGVGRKVIQVQDRAAIQPSYEFAAGQLVLDLSAVDLGEATVPITIDHHIGQLDVVLPERASLTSHVQIDAGQAQVLGREDNGLSVDLRVEDSAVGATGRVDLQVDMGFGQVLVCRAPAGATQTGGCGGSA